VKGDFVAAMLTISMLCCWACGDDSKKLVSSEDTFAHHSYPDKTANAQIRLGVGYREETNLPYREGWTYLKFSLAAVPDDAVIASAVLYLVDSGNLPHNSLEVGVYAVTDDSWSASTLTWNDKPDTAKTATANTTVSTVSTTNNQQLYSWDITSLVKTNNIASDDVLSVCLKENPQQTTTDTWAMFVSTRDPDSNNHPYLVITYAPKADAKRGDCSNDNLVSNHQQVTWSPLACLSWQGEFTGAQFSLAGSNNSHVNGHI